jgi:hypothetical protein
MPRPFNEFFLNGRRGQSPWFTERNSFQWSDAMRSPASAGVPTCLFVRVIWQTKYLTRIRLRNLRCPSTRLGAKRAKLSANLHSAAFWQSLRSGGSCPTVRSNLRSGIFRLQIDGGQASPFGGILLRHRGVPSGGKLGPSFSSDAPLLVRGESEASGRDMPQRGGGPTGAISYGAAAPR